MTVPHDASNPHHVRLARVSETPLRASDRRTRPSDISCVEPSILLLNDQNFTTLRRFVDQLTRYVDDIEAIQAAALEAAAEETDSAQLLRHHGLLSSPFHNDGERLKTCARHLTIHAEREDPNGAKTEVCRKLESIFNLLR